MRISRRAGIGLLGGVAATLAAGVAVGATSGGDTTASLAAQLDPSRPKNVILLVGDGMGDSEVTLGRYYGKGAAGRLNMDRLAFRGSSIHYVLRAGPGPEYAPNYVGDSAPTATAWSTGERTQDGRLSQGPSAADTVPGSNAGYDTYMEIARDAGKATGNVSTARSRMPRRPRRARTYPSAPARARPTRARPARRRPGPQAAWARSPSSRSTRASTSSSAAVATASRRRSPPAAPRRSSSTRRPTATT